MSQSESLIETNWIQAPQELKQLAEPPPLVQLRGSLSFGPKVAIVGTRKPSDEAVSFTVQLASHLASLGVTIVSGGALGIDSAAHRGALLVNGHTIVMVPSGLEEPYPVENRPLFDEILNRGGALLSLFESDEKSKRWMFFRRNAALAAYSDLVIMVEAPFRSGARNALATARKLGKPVAVVPGAPWNPRATGCIQELEWGAKIISSPRGAERLLQRLLLAQGRSLSVTPERSSEVRPVTSIATKAASPKRVEKAENQGELWGRPVIPLEPLLEKLLKLLKEKGSSTPEQLAEGLGQSWSCTQKQLMELLLLGKVECDARGCYQALAHDNRL